MVPRTEQEKLEILAEAFTKADLKTKALFESLSKSNQDVVFDLLLDYINTGSLDKLQQHYSLDYKWLPVDVLTFFNNPYYFGRTASNLWPIWQEEAVYLANHENIFECILTGCIGGGKTTFSVAYLSYIIYLLTCLKNPRSFYGLTDESSFITIILLSTTLRQVGRAGYAKINRGIIKSQYFVEQCKWEKSPDRLKDKDIILNDQILITAGSREGHAIGSDVFASLLDEINFRESKSNRRILEEHNTNAYDMYNAVASRITSRFLAQDTLGVAKIPGMLFLASSETSHSSFTATRIKEIQHKQNARVKRLRLWETDPKKKGDGKTFRLYIGDTINRPKILQEEESCPEDKVLHVPVMFRDSFEADIMLACRDIAGLPTQAISPLITHLDSFWSCFLPHTADNKAGEEHPFTQDTLVLGIPLTSTTSIIDYFISSKLFCAIDAIHSRYRLTHRPNTERWIHVDLSKSSDCTGISMIHVSSNTTLKRKSLSDEELITQEPIFSVDFVLHIKPPLQGEIDYSDIIAFIEFLESSGVIIAGVSYDGYQSAHSVQYFKKKGWNATLVSVDKTSLPYLFLKRLFLENRISCYYHPVLCSELLSLNIDQAERGREIVDHPQGGSKDLSDSLCGAIYNCFMSKYTENDLLRALDTSPIVTDVKSTLLRVNNIQQKNVNSKIKVF